MNNSESLHWYHKVTRTQADDQLKDSENGVFLVRDSNTSPGDYVLSVLHNHEVFHYQIRHHGEDAFYSIDDQTPIHGLDSLIEHYRENPEGLVTRLSGIYPGGGAPPAESRRHGRTNLLHRATKNGSLLVVESMIKSNNKKNTYPLDAKDQDGRSAVHLACLLDENAESILEKLIDSGANVNCRDEEGNTPLHYACRTKPVSLIKMLVDAQAHIDARNSDTWRVPLHEAASYGNLAVVKYLLELKAPHLPRSTSDETPIQLAREAKQRAVVEFLENYNPPEPKIESSHYCHGTMDRSESDRIVRKFVKENKLKEEDMAGTFLVRHSTRENSKILGLLNEENVFKNYVIKESPHHYYYIDEGPYMLTLNHLVEHYMRFSDGLPTKLRNPVPPIDKPPLPPAHPQVIVTPQKKGISMLFPKLGKSSKEESSATEKISPSQSKERNLSLPSDNLLSPSSANDSIVSNGSSPSPPDTNKTKDSSRKPSCGSLNFPLNILTMKRTKKQPKPKAKDSDDGKDSSISNLAIMNGPISDSMKRLKFKINDKEESSYNVPSNIPATHHALAAERFTRSDKQKHNRTDATEPELFKEEGIYFVEPPTKVVPLTAIYNNDPPLDFPFFPHSTNTAFDLGLNSNGKMNANIFQSGYVESHLSMDSTFSNELDLMLAENRADVQCPNYYIPSASITKISMIGNGEFGEVWKSSMKCEEKNGEINEIDVAVKTLINQENRTDFLREASVMIKLKHHCIVKMLGISKGPTLMIVQELVPYGALPEYLKENREQINPNFELRIWASQIACGMNYLESKHFVHRDLAARNILVMSQQQVKISDFGLSRALGVDDDYYQSNRGGRWPIKWYAPECMNYGNFSHAGDVWSFGVTLWEMYTFGEIPPYGEISQTELTKLLEDGVRLSRPEHCPLNVYEIMHNCWNYNGKDRPTFRYLTEFFSNDPDYQSVVELLKQQKMK